MRRKKRYPHLPWISSIKDFLTEHNSMYFWRDNDRNPYARGGLRSRWSWGERRWETPPDSGAITLWWWPREPCTELHCWNSAWYRCDGFFHANVWGWQKCSNIACDGHREQVTAYEIMIVTRWRRLVFRKCFRVVSTDRHLVRWREGNLNPWIHLMVEMMINQTALKRSGIIFTPKRCIPYRRADVALS